jgi:5'-3' exoribonuclease 1
MALQTAVHQVTFEDERYLEKDAPPIASDFPTGEKVIFLGDMAYGTAAQVSATHGNALDIGIAYFPGERKENLTYTKLVMTRPSSQYTPSHALARRLGISSLALSRVTSTLMVALSTNSKTNVGLSLKFESKGLKVLGYSRKADRNWEFSDKCARLIAEYRDAFPEPFRHLDNRGGDIVTSAELCPSAEDPDQVIKDMHKWLKTRGVNDLEPVSLFAESLEKETVHQIEQLSNHFREQRSKDSIKRVQIKGIPRQAVLKPSHAIYRLQGQRFALGDRVIMVQDAAAGGVPLAMKGVVVGLGTRDIDVVWDVPFMGGETLMGRCSDYRGSTVPFCSCLNLSHPQFAIGSESAPQTVGTTQAFQPQLGPRPVVAPNNYRPSIPSHRPTQILQNPRSHPPPQRGPMQYGNAAKGIRPEAQSAPAVSHQDRLQSTLLGQAPRAHPQPPVPRQHVAKMPHIRPVSPTAIQHQLPHSNGHGAAGNGPGAPPARGAPGGRGGRGRGGGGRGAPRGRGRGRGGAAGVGAAPAAAPESAA